MGYRDGSAVALGAAYTDLPYSRNMRLELGLCERVFQYPQHGISLLVTGMPLFPPRPATLPSVGAMPLHGRYHRGLNLSVRSSA